jgi:signal peptidase I
MDAMDASPVQKRPLIADDLVKFALIALLIVIPVRIFIAQPFIVRGASMQPTFESGEYLIVDQLSYRFHPPQRGDVIIMRYPKDPSVFFIKRVIGLPNETVGLAGPKVTIERPGASAITLSEPYVASGRLENEYATYTLGPTDYFVMGDNRIESSDSRAWGLLPRADIIGHAFVRLLPPTRMSFLPGEAAYANN